jgi:hypothetical protein
MALQDGMIDDTDDYDSMYGLCSITIFRAEKRLRLKGKRYPTGYIYQAIGSLCGVTNDNHCVYPYRSTRMYDSNSHNK